MQKTLTTTLCRNAGTQISDHRQRGELDLAVRQPIARRAIDRVQDSIEHRCMVSVLGNEQIPFYGQSLAMFLQQPGRMAYQARREAPAF